MATFGFQGFQADLLRITRMVIGLIPIMAGPGSLIIPGDGHLIIMVVGIMTLIMVGPGFPIMYGDQPG